jgi:hypothetical protein
MGQPCKVYVVDPFACTVTEADHTGDYRHLYTLLSHESMPVDCFTAAYPRNLEGRDCVFVDDNGLLKPCDRFFTIEGYLQPLAGKGLILGADEEGDTVSPATPIETIRKRVAFLAIDGRFLIQTSEPWAPPHPKVKHGQCPTCRHYGEDCTGDDAAPPH